MDDLPNSSSITNLAAVGAALRDARKSLGLTASDLARQAGISRNTLGALESGRGNVELNTLLALLRQLGLRMQFVPEAVADLARFGADTRSTGLQDEVRGLMPPARLDRPRGARGVQGAPSPDTGKRR